MVRCDHCDLACLGQSRLDEHVKQCHSSIDRNGKYKCEWCEYSTDKKHYLEAHRHFHPGEPPYRCDECGKTFALRAYLRTHLSLHTGEKPLSCDVCGKRFRLYSTLHRHKRVHAGENVRNGDQDGVKEYQCQECSARFTARSTLNRHMRLHIDRPYGCSFCSARFSALPYLSRHVTAVHTPGSKYRCERCGREFIEAFYLRRHVDEECGQSANWCTQSLCHCSVDHFLSLRWGPYMQGVRKPEFQLWTWAWRSCLCSPIQSALHFYKVFGAFRMEGSTRAELALSRELVAQAQATSLRWVISG